MSSLEEGKMNTLTLKDATVNLRTSIGEKMFQQYGAILTLFFSRKITKLKFDEEARKLLCNVDQIHLHNLLLFALTEKLQNFPVKDTNYISEKGTMRTRQDDYNEGKLKYVAQEMCLPEYDLIKCRMLFSSFQYDLDGAGEDVTKLIIIAVQMYLKNILSAAISKCSGYKLRDKTFQNAIGVPVPDPWLRNYNNIIDTTQETSIDVNCEEENLQPIIRNTLESVQQQTAFAYSCSGTRTINSCTRISLKSLYETLLENPGVINNNSIYSINLEKILNRLNDS